MYVPAPRAEGGYVSEPFSSGFQINASSAQAQLTTSIRMSVGTVCAAHALGNTTAGPGVRKLFPLHFFFHFGHRYGLRVLLDIHAVAGSQNGFDNSGQVGG